MENIWRAIERAKARDRVGGEGTPAARIDRRRAPPPHYEAPIDYDLPSEAPLGYAAEVQEVALDSAHLRSERIVAHVVTDPLTRPFDMLRTQTLQAMDAAGSKILAITSPTPGCGKTVTAVNLAFSIARQAERSVLLIDLDFQKPRVAPCLGFQSDYGVLGVLHERSSLDEAVVRVTVGNEDLLVLPTSSSTGSAELMASQAMAMLFQDLKRSYASQIIIVDLPPILSSDDVLAVLPLIDCVLLVVGVGTTKVSEIEECTKHLQSTEVVRIAVNKVPNTETAYGYY